MQRANHILLFSLFMIILANSAISLSPVQAADHTVIYPGNARFERLTVEDGLPNATVLSVLQDRQGFMWFATADGVGRYDGYNFVTFRHEITNLNSLSNNNTFALMESRDGLIWIGTDPGGLNVYDPETGQFTLYMHDDANPKSLIDNSIWSLMEAQDGSIWVGTRGGLGRLDRKTGEFKTYQVDPENPRSLAGIVVYRIYQDRSGTIWIGTRGGLQRYDPATDDFTLFANDPDNPDSISSSNVWAMLEDRQGVFWVGTRSGGLNRFDRTTGKFTSFQNDPNNPRSLSNNNIFNLYEDSEGRLWIATENGGLNLFDSQTETFVSFQHNPNDQTTLSNNDVFWITEDRSGVLWITSRYGGVNKLYPSLWRFGLYRSVPNDPNSLSSNSVYSILAEENGTIWIGTFGGGLNRFDRTTGKMTVYKNDPKNPASLSSDKVYSVCKDEKGIFWISTSGGGLNRLDPVTGTFTAFRYTPELPTVIGSNFITIVKSAGNNKLWVGTLGFGLNLFNAQTGLMEKEYETVPGEINSLTEGTIYDLAVESSGRVWIATARGGLELLDPGTDTFTHHRNDPNNPNSILSDAVNAIYLDDKNGVIWAGTGGGLSRFDMAAQQWQNFTKHDGLPSDTITGIQPGKDGEIWVSTGKGISRLIPETKTFTNFNVQDGLQGDQFSIGSSNLGPDGEIFFGGSNGVTYFRPEQITSNTYLPPVVFTDFLLFNQQVAAGTEILPEPIEFLRQITLRHDQSVFTIRFSTLSYQLSSKNLYQYKMEGFDKDWSPPRDKQEATYTSLPPGRYPFKVRASNNDGIWNDNAGSIEIIILPPWWETWWFRLAVFVVGASGILAAVQVRTSGINTRNRELEKRVMERTQELEESQQKLHEVNLELQAQLDSITVLEKELREMAIHDALTGLYNRHYLSERLAAEYSRARRGNHSIAFLLMDMDHFKNINDTYGHLAGDYTLQSAAKIISAQTRRSDIACRYGGEEFMVVMPDILPRDAMLRAEYFRTCIEELPIEFDGKIIHLTVSIGLAIFPQHGEDNDTILSSVDTALYQAKAKGRNQTVLYQAD